jgi:hypothetical protein
MSADIYDWGMNKSTMTYDGWVIKLRQVCLVRLKQVRHIRGSDCSSWPTVLGVDATVGAVISKDDKFKMTKTGRLRKINRNGKDGSLGLARTVKMWRAVRSSSANGASEKEVQNGNPKKRLETEVMNWPTPRAQEPGSTSAGYGKGLKNMATNWRTPNASDAEGGVMEWRDGKAAKLKLRDHSVHAVKSWATPTSRDWKDGSATDKAPTNCQLGRQAPRSMIDGDMSKLTLNPQFTEWLMGWPIGWTESEPVATAWCLWWQHMRGELLLLEQISMMKVNDER